MRLLLQSTFQSTKTGNVPKRTYTCIHLLHFPSEKDIIAKANMLFPPNQCVFNDILELPIHRCILLPLDSVLLLLFEYTTVASLESVVTFPWKPI